MAAYLRQQAPSRPPALIAVGKAASAMLQGALDALGEHYHSAFVLTKDGHLDPDIRRQPRLSALLSAHPLPDQRSIDAAHALLDHLQQLPQNCDIILLLSGGASALLEYPIDGIDAAQLQQINQWLLGSGLDIHAINRVRQRLSRLKGGGLASYLYPRRVLNLIISDVPGDDIASIGSGLLSIPPAQPLPELPAWLHAQLQNPPPAPQPAHFANIQQHIIARSSDARHAASAYFQQHGYRVNEHPDMILGDARQAGQQLGQQLRHMPPGIHLYASETTVTLPPQPGAGGRCQSLALAAACEIADTPGCYLLAAASDGNDGPGSDAGALVDSETLHRAEVDQHQAHDYLQRADAGSCLALSGDLINTAATGTNVMDIIILLRSADFPA